MEEKLCNVCFLIMIFFCYTIPCHLLTQVACCGRFRFLLKLEEVNKVPAGPTRNAKLQRLLSDKQTAALEAASAKIVVREHVDNQTARGAGRQ